jgi:hypothetical protein
MILRITTVGRIVVHLSAHRVLSSSAGTNLMMTKQSTVKTLLSIPCTLLNIHHLQNALILYINTDFLGSTSYMLINIR